MPPWVARQCFVLGHRRFATRALYNSRLSCQLRVITQQQRTNASKPPTLDVGYGSIIIPSSVADTQPADLISRITPLNRHPSKDHVTVFFLTPAFATWLLDDRVFLQGALNQVYQRIMGAPLYERIHAVTAVVDKLPAPKPIENPKDIRREALHRMQTPPVSETGFEGMAYMTLPSSDFHYTPRTSADEKGAVSFVNSSLPKEGIYYMDIFRLALAKTIFQTGSPTTLTLSTWEKQEDASSWIPLSKNELAEASINLQRHQRVDRISVLSIPLIPLTVPRLVDASLGNILRRVIGEDGKSVAASEELERVVPEYLRSRNVLPQTLSVWALLIPQNLLESVGQDLQRFYPSTRAEGSTSDVGPDSHPWASVWKTDPPKWNELVAVAVSKGARLHRVLSGGGGWGKKAGLLSLDPGAFIEELISSTADPPEAVEDEEDMIVSRSFALKQVVHNEDSIQFFVSPAPELSSVGGSEGSVLEQLSDTRMPWHWEIGTIPSTVDVAQAKSWQHDNSSPKEVFTFRNSFGALSEGAMSFKRQIKIEQINHLGLLGGATVDVPFSRFSSVSVTPQEEEEPATGEVKTARKEVKTAMKKGKTAMKGVKLSTKEAETATGKEGPVTGDSVHNIAHVQTCRSDAELMNEIYGRMTPSLLYLPHTGPLQARPEAPPTGFVPPVTPKFAVTTHLNADVGKTIELIEKLRVELYDDLKNRRSSRVDNIADALHLSYDRPFDTKKEILDVLPTISQNPIDSLVYRSNQGLQSIHELGTQAARIIFFAYKRARFVAKANNSAIDVYLLHALLRQQITSQLTSYPGWNMGKQGLAKRLKQLKSFNRNLFVHFTAPSHRFYMDKLQALEEEYTDEPVMGDEATRTLAKEEGKAPTELTARKISRGDDIRAPQKSNKPLIRKVDPALEIRYHHPVKEARKSLGNLRIHKTVLVGYYKSESPIAEPIPPAGKSRRREKAEKLKAYTVRKRKRRREILEQVSGWLGGL